MRKSFTDLRRAGDPTFVLCDATSKRQAAIRGLIRKMSNTVVRIGLVMTHTLDFYRQILRGVRAFAVERPDWVFSPIAPEKRAIELARPLRCDGYVAHVFTLPLAQALLALRKPVVSVAG